MFHKEILILEVDDPLAVAALNVNLAVVEALGLQVFLFDHFTPGEEAALKTGLFQSLKGVAAVLGTTAQLMTDFFA